MLKFRIWEARRKSNPNQGTLWDDNEPNDPVAAAQAAIAKLNIQDNDGMQQAIIAVTDIANRHNIPPNELWHDVMYQPDGFSRDIENQPTTEKPTVYGAKGEDAFIQHIANEFRTRYKKQALAKAQEELQNQQAIASGQAKGNRKHAAKMIGYLDKVVSLLQ